MLKLLFGGIIIGEQYPSKQGKIKIPADMLHLFCRHNEYLTQEEYLTRAHIDTGNYTILCAGNKIYENLEKIPE